MADVRLSFYQYTGKPNAVDKSLGSSPLSVTGTFRMPLDVLNPVVLIDFSPYPSIDASSFLITKYNYVFITGGVLERYYFITSMRAINDELVELELREDVLMQYRESIYSLQCIMNRCSSATAYEMMVDDPAIKFKTESKVRLFSLPATSGAVTFNANSTDNFVVINAYSKFNSDQETTADTRPAYTDANLIASGLPDVDRQNFAIGGFSNYDTPAHMGNEFFRSDTFFMAVKSGSFVYIQNKAIEDDEIKNNIRSCIALPYVWQSGYSLKKYAHPHIGGKMLAEYVDTDGNPTTAPEWEYINAWFVNPNSGYLKIAEFNIETMLEGNASFALNDFTRFAPHRNYEIYLPFCGWATIPQSSLRNDLVIYYVVDYATGQANAYIYDKTEGLEIFSTVCQLGVVLDITGTNQAELTRQRTSNGLNTALQVIGGGLSMLAGVATENPLAFGAGAVSLARGIGGGVVTELNMINKASIGYANGTTALFSPLVPALRVTYHESINDSVRSIIGYPSCLKIQLSALRGTGFANITDVFSHLYGGIMRTEWEEIVRLLKEGVYL